MDQRVARGWSRGLLSIFGSCALALAACSSTKSPPGPDGGGNADANGAFVDAVDAMAPSNCPNCSITSHVLTQQAPPNDCTFTIGEVPPDPANVRVRDGATVIPLSDTEGWVYEVGMTAITLKGSYCVSARNGTISSLTMLFGCPSCPIP